MHRGENGSGLAFGIDGLCRKHGIEVEKNASEGSPYSIDANLLHVSYEGGVLEDPWAPADESMWLRTIAPEHAPEEADYVEIDFVDGDAIALDGKALSPASLLETLNNMAGKHGIGRVDIVENRCTGIKSRGVMRRLEERCSQRRIGQLSH